MPLGLKAVALSASDRRKASRLHSMLLSSMYAIEEHAVVPPSGNDQQGPCMSTACSDRSLPASDRLLNFDECKTGEGPGAKMVGVLVLLQRKRLREAVGD